MVLADLGARVIKIEEPEAGDLARGIGPFIGGKSAYFASLNRGKESIALDLKSSDDDRSIFDALLDNADVLVENFRPGAMKRLGYDWETLQAKYPGLIYVAVSGFGHTGPHSSRPAFDMVIQGMGGLMSLTGQPGGPPTRVGTSIGDITAGLFAAIGINGALYQRERTGHGTFVDIAMLDCQVAILENAIARYVATGSVPGPLGSRHPSIAPFSAFAASDGHIIIAAGSNEQFQILSKVIGRPELALDPRYDNPVKRVENVEDLQRDLEDVLRTQTSAHWLQVMEEARLPCGPIYNIEQVMNDPHVQARNMVVAMNDPLIGRIKLAGNPVKMSCSDDPSERGPAPDLNSSRECLLAELGLA
jgi:CoA:oxalate CoA-transferase